LTNTAGEFPVAILISARSSV